MIMQLSLSQNQYTGSRIEDLENRLIHVNILQLSSHL